MTKFLTRLCAALTAMLLIAALAVNDLPVMNVFAADTPIFTLESSVTSAKTGDIVTVSLYVDNPTESTLSSFDGDITFNSSHFRYVDFSCPDVISKKLTCRDSEAAASSKISLIFSDTTKTIIPAGTTHLLLLQLRFSVISPVSGSGQIICTINNSYSGSTSFGDITPATLQLAVEYATSTETTASSTTTTTTTTKQRSSDARLRSLSVAPGTLSPTFNPEFVAYTVSVEFEVATIRISAAPNSSAAVASGIGIKDLAVGQNTFTVTVTAEDGTVMQYGIVVIRAAETQATTSTTSSTTTSSTTPYIDPTDISTITGYTEPTTTPLPTASQPDKIIEGGNEPPSDTELVKIIGIIFAEVALFMFGFLAGFFLDKNMRKKTIAEITYGPLDRQQSQRRDYYPPSSPMQDYNQPEYSDYPPEYPDYQPEYQNYSDGYQQESYPQYSGYDNGQRFDEYGNPILDNAQYDDGFWEYGDNHNDPYYH